MAVFLLMKYGAGPVGVISDAIDGLNGTIGGIVGSVQDWAYSAANPYSDDAEEQRFYEVVNQKLKDQYGYEADMQGGEVWTARGYSLLQPIKGPFSKLQPWQLQLTYATDSNIYQQAASEAAQDIITRRGKRKP